MTPASPPSAATSWPMTSDDNVVAVVGHDAGRTRMTGFNLNRRYDKWKWWVDLSRVPVYGLLHGAMV